MRKTWLIGSLIVLLIIAALIGYYFYIEAKLSGSALSPQAVATNIRSGDYQNAARTTEEILKDPNASENQKAFATFNSIGAQFYLTGDPSSRLADVASLKSIVTNNNVELSLRVNALNALAMEYSISGGDTKVSDAVFKDAPFSQYYATSSTPDLTARLSGRKLFEWSYSMQPTSFAAIQIARWYSEQRPFYGAKLSASTTAAYASEAEDWLQKADAASVREAAQDPQFKESARSITYRYWRAVILGRLAIQVGAPFSAQFMDEYKNLFDFLGQVNNVLGKSFTYYARMYYSQALRDTGHPDLAKIQLDQFARELNAITDPDRTVYVLFLRNEYRDRPTGPTWKNLVAREFKLSSDFESAVMKLVASTTPAR